MPEQPVEVALDELYGVDPSEFVAVRKRLSAALRGEDKAGAKVLLSARRPSTSAWALNQVARREPQLVEGLLEASRALFAAQTRGSNKPDVLREAIRTHREAVEAASDAALAVLGNRANDKFRDEIVSTLRAVSTDERASEQLRTGRVIREASSSGFPDATGLTLVPDLPAAKPRPKAKTPATATAKEAPATKDDSKAAKAARDQEREREREEQRRAAVALKESARKEAEVAAAEVEKLQARIDEIHDELDAARRELTTARSRSRTAKSKLRDLR